MSAGSVNPHGWGIPASRRVASCTDGPRDGIRACSDVAPLRSSGRRMESCLAARRQSPVGLSAVSRARVRLRISATGGARLSRSL